MKWKNGQSKVEVRSWIEGIGRGSPSPDLLTEFDQLNDGSLGGLGEALEKMHNSDRAVPLFEFRDLKHKRTDQFGDFLAEVDQSIQDLHRDFAQAPRMMKRDTIGACTPPYYTNHTSTGISGSHVTGALDSNQLHRALASGTGTLTTSTIAPT